MLATESTKTSSNKVNTYLDNSLDHAPVLHSLKYWLKTSRLGLKMSKSTGLDRISAIGPKNCISVNAPSLTFIFDLSLSSVIFVDEWKNERMCPVYKGKDRLDLGNYRPISILSKFSRTKYLTNFMVI